MASERERMAACRRRRNAYYRSVQICWITCTFRGSATNVDTCLELWSLKIERAEKLTGLRRYIVSALYREAYHVQVITINYDYNHVLHFQHVPSLIIT